MKPNKEGQIVKFHNPLPDEDPKQLYVVLELKIDGKRDRADIQALGTGLAISPINTVLIDDLEIVEVDTSDLMGHTVTVQKSDYSEVTGKVIKASEQMIFLNLTKGVSGVETNVWLTVIDASGSEHTGTLVVR